MKHLKQNIAGILVFRIYCARQDTQEPKNALQHLYYAVIQYDITQGYVGIIIQGFVYTE